MTKALDHSTLATAIADGSAALRCNLRLNPAAGSGGKVFPPTYEGATYATEQRRMPAYREAQGKDGKERDELVHCVLLDSVQSQANRIEEVLQDAIDEGRIELPLVEVGFDHLKLLDHDDDSDETELGLYDPIGRVTSLQAPHRVADAILRDSQDASGTPFRKTEAGRQLDHASLRNATPLYDICPTALVFGVWDSTGPRGGLGAKFQRTIVSEIIGIDMKKGANTSSRIDPLAIRKGAALLYEHKEGGWTLDETAAVKVKGKAKLFKKEGKPSEANHGNVVPSLSDLDRDKEPLAGGVTIDHAQLSTVLSLPALRRLRFPIENEQTRERNLAGQTVLAAIALTGTALMLERGLDLRSRCLLCADEAPTWELLGPAGSATHFFTLDADDAVQILNEAIRVAEKAGLAWRKEPMKLVPQPKLVELLKRSQELAMQGGGDDKDGA